MSISVIDRKGPTFSICVIWFLEIFKVASLYNPFISDRDFRRLLEMLTKRKLRHFPIDAGRSDMLLKSSSSFCKDCIISIVEWICLILFLFMDNILSFRYPMFSGITVNSLSSKKSSFNFRFQPDNLSGNFESLFPFKFS